MSTPRIRVTLVCHHCKKTYERIPSRAKESRYCSNKCRATHLRRPLVRCRGCGNHFHPKRDSHTYCTPECRKKNVGKTRMHRVTKRCKRCGKPMIAPWSRRNRKNYCSVECRGKDRRVKRVPTADQLRHLVDYLTYEQIAREYEVCMNTVANWTRRYGIRPPLKKKQIRGPNQPWLSGYVGEAYGA